MRTLILGTLALLIAILGLTELQNNRLKLDPHDQLSFERQNTIRRQQLAATNTTFPAPLTCAATHVSRETVQTLTIAWLNNRPDLVVSNRDAASADLSRAIQTCHGKEKTLEDQAHQAGMELENEAALAMLQAGR